jgi:hypothetical protein
MNAPPPGQARLAIVGATGMVGGYALRYALDHPAVGTVMAIGRRTLGIQHPKLKEVLHRDFADCSALADALTGQDAAVFCLGAYAGAVPDTELRKVTADYTIEFASGSSHLKPRCGLFLLERQRRGPDGTKPARFRPLQGRGRERVAGGRVFPRLHLPTCLHLSGGASQRTEFRLPPVARNLSRVSGAVPQSGDPGRRFGPRHGGCCRAQNGRARRLGSGKP